jgi:hypothetical protein
MHVPSHPTLIRRMLQARLQRLTPTQPLLAGSLGAVTRRCGNPGCRCHHGGPKHPAHQLTFKDRGRSRSVHVPHDLVPQVQTWLRENRRLHDLLQEIHQLSRALIRSHVRHRRRQQGRP